MQQQNNEVTDSQVAAARERSDAMQTKVQTIESDIETLRAADADITSLSTTELAAQITTTKAMALGARTIADETRQAAGLYEQVEAELRQVRTDRTALDDELRTTDQRRSRLEGALGAAANEPVAILRAQALDAASARTQADQLVERRAELTQTVHTTEQEIDTIGLNQIAVQSRRTSSADQLIDRQRHSMWRRSGTPTPTERWLSVREPRCAPTRTSRFEPGPPAMLGV